MIPFENYNENLFQLLHNIYNKILHTLYKIENWLYTEVSFYN